MRIFFLSLFLLPLASLHLFAIKGTSFFKYTAIDLGTIAVCEECKFVFEYTNLSGHVVTIDSIRTSCGCMITSYTNSLIKKKEQGKLVIAIRKDDVIGDIDEFAVVYISGIKPTILKIKGKTKN